MPSRTLTCVVALAALSACRPTLPRAARTGVRLRAEGQVASQLPADTAVYLVAPSLRRLWEHADGPGLVTLLRRRATRLFYTAEREVGVVPRPEALEMAGIDVDGGAGFAAILHEEELIPFGFVTLAHPGRLEAALYRFAAREGHGRPRSEGDAVLVDGDAITWILRDDLAFIAPKSREHLCTLLATFDPGDEGSLSERPAFAEAMAGKVGRRTSVAGFVDLRVLAYDEFGLDPRWAGADGNAARADLEAHHRQALTRARGAGASTVELAEIDASYRGWRRQLRSDPRAEAIRAIWGEISGAAFQLQVGPSRATLEARVTMPREAPLARILKQGRPRRTPLKSIDTPPYAAVELHAEPELLRRHLSGLLPGSDDDFAGALMAVLDGSAGVAIVDGRDGPALGARFGLRDPAAAQALLLKVARASSMHIDGKDVVLGVRGLPPIRVGIRDEAIIAGSHHTLFERFRRLDEAPSYGDVSRVARMLRRSPAAMVFGGEVAALVAGPVPPFVRAPDELEPSGEDPANPRAEIEAELKRIERELELIGWRRRQRFVDLRRSWAADVGQFAVTLGWSGGALQLQVRWEGESSPAQALVRLLNGAPHQRALVSTDLDVLVTQLNARAFDLLGRLQKLEGVSAPAPEDR